MARLQDAKEPDPWKFGFGVVHEDVLVGMCGFVALPDANGVVEIGYGIAPACRGKGYATEVAQALVEFASNDERVRTICAHTLPEANASTRVLEKCGFRKTGEIVDSENQRVGRWERKPTS